MDMYFFYVMVIVMSVSYLNSFIIYTKWVLEKKNLH